MRKSILSVSMTLCLCIAIQAQDKPAVDAGQGDAQDNTVQLTIDAGKQGNVISPLLFGPNLEHTRRAIWQGIGAEMIANRKFAAVDCGLPMRWTTLTGKGVGD